MENKDKQGFMNRRGMLKSFGLAGAAIATAPILGVGEAALRAAMIPSSAEMKIGILTTGNYSSSFLNGLNLYLDQVKAAKGSIPFSTAVEDYDGSLKSATAKLAKLIDEQSISFAVGLMNSKVSQFLAPAVDTANIGFIEANLGESFFHKDLTSDRFYQNSLNLWQSHYLLGEYAANNVGMKAICATSFTDAGYDAMYAFTAGFTAAGGTVANALVSGSPADDSSPVTTAGLCASSDADVVFMNYSGSDASVFLSAFKNSGSTKAIYTSGMILQSRVLTNLGSDAEGIIGAHTWDFDSATTFDTAYKTKYNSDADDFAVLGYDTGAILCSAAGQMTRSLNPASFATAMSGMQITSPRGTVTMNNNTHAFEAPVSIIRMNDNGTKMASTILNSSAIDTSLTAGDYRLTDDAHSGAVMAYPGE